MNKSAANQFRRERGDELNKLAALLQRKGILQDGEPLRSAAGDCNVPPSLLDEFQTGRPRKGVEFWSYQINNLLFRGVDEDCLRHSIPSGLIGVEINLNVYLYGFCLDDNLYDIANPFVKLSVNIETLAQDKNGKPLKCAWHLDKNITELGDNVSKFAHPDFHFQHGGIKVRSVIDYGEHILLDVPRLAHPPLDGILAVDFVLSNYFGSKWTELRNDSEYQKLLRAAQERCWYSYAFATAMEWTSPINWQGLGFNSSWNADGIWSQIIPK